MVLVSLTPEGIASFKKLPGSAKTGFDAVLSEWEALSRLRLPGDYRAHQLEGSPPLWTLKVGLYRGIFRWDRNEARFVRFGHRETVYHRLPK